MLTFVPHKISEEYKTVEFYRVNKELCNNELYKNLIPTAILLYTLLYDRLSMSYSNIKNNISKKFNYYDDEKKHWVYFDEISENILKSMPKQNKFYIQKQLNELEDNYLDYLAYWDEKYYRNEFCDGMQMLCGCLEK